MPTLRVFIVGRRLVLCILMASALMAHGDDNGCENMIDNLGEDPTCKGCDCDFDSDKVDPIRCERMADFMSMMSDSASIVDVIRRCTERLDINCDDADEGKDYTLDLTGFEMLEHLEVNHCPSLSKVKGSAPTTLKILDLEHNALTYLDPTFFSNFQSDSDDHDGPSHMRLNYNAFSAISSSTFPTVLPAHTYYLELSYNEITSINVAGMSGPDLRALELEQNKLSQNTNICVLGNMAPSLERIDLKSAGLTSVSSLHGCSALTSLRSLILSDNDIKGNELPDLSQMTSLGELIAQRTGIGAVKPEHLPTGLLELSLDGNDIGSLDTQLFTRLTQITSLTLSLSKINLQGEKLSSATLKKLYLASNGIASLPSSMDFPSLIELDLSYNDLNTINADLLAEMPKLQILRLASNDIDSLPSADKVAQHTPDMKFVDLSDNSFKLVSEVKSFIKALNATPAKLSDVQSKLGGSAGLVVDLSGSPASCYSIIYSSSFFDTQCGCSKGYKRLGHKCVLGKSYWLAVGIAAGVSASIGLVCLLLLAKYVRTRRLLGYTKLQRDEANQELIQFKRAWEISPDEIEIDVPIDVNSPGQFSDVFGGHFREFKVAIKFIKSKFLVLGDAAMTRDLMQSFEKEVDFMSKCRHTNIVYFFGAGYKDNIPFLVTKFMANGSLSQYLREHKGQVDWATKRQFVLDIAHGLQFIHSFGRVHRDVKAANVLLDEDMSCKISDFGTIKTLVVQNAVRHRRDPSQSLIRFMRGSSSSVGDLQGQEVEDEDPVGTPFYMPPEALVRRPQLTTAADVWSFGVVMWEICAERTPDICDELLENHRGPTLITIKTLLDEGQRLPVDESWPRVFQTVMKNCWDSTPTVRPTLGKVITQLNAAHERKSSE